MSDASASAPLDAFSRLREAAFLIIAAADAVSAATGHLPRESANLHLLPLNNLVSRFQEALTAFGGRTPPSSAAWRINSTVTSLLDEYRRLPRPTFATPSPAASPEKDAEIERLREEVASLKELRAKDKLVATLGAPHSRPPKPPTQRPDSTPAAPPGLPGKSRGQKPAATPKAAHFTYVSAAKAGLPVIASQLAVAFPKDSAANIFHMADKLVSKKASGPKPRHAPPRSSHRIDVYFDNDQSPPAEKVPLDGPLYHDLLDALGNSPNTAGAPPLESVVWNHRGRFRLTFTGAIPPTLDATLTNYFARFARNRQATSVHLERFRFKSSAVYRRVPAIEGLDDAATSQRLADQLRASPQWAGIQLERPIHFFRPKNSAYGMLFVEFSDNAMSRTLKYVTSHPIYLNGALCHAVRTVDTKPPVPQCALCLRWGHRTQLCRSPTRRCWACGDHHDERSHQGSGDPFCINCSGTHRADSKECPYYQHRRDPDWIRRQNTSRIPKSNTTAPATIRGSARGVGSGRKGKTGMTADGMVTD